MVQYFYPYRYRLQENWHDALIEFIPKVAQTDSSNYRQVISDLILRMNDRQTYIISSNFSGLGRNAPPLQVEYVENKPVITGSYMVGGLSNELAPGDVITKIDQIPVEEIAEQIRTRLGDARLTNYLLRTNDESIQIEYLRHGQIFTANARCYSWEELRKHRISGNTPEYKLLTDEVGYFFPHRFFDEKFAKQAMNDFRNTKGIIIDLRHNETFSRLLEYISPHLTSQVVDFAKLTPADIQIPGLFAYGKTPERTGAGNRNHYKGKIVVLINQNTNDVAEYAAMALRALPNTVILGSATANNGRISRKSLASFQLPFNISGSMPCHGLYYPDGSPAYMGIIPDIEVKPTIQGIIDGRDELIEKAMEIILKN